MWCFAHFDLQMRLAPQRRVIFWHLIFKKWSEHVVLFAFLTYKSTSLHSSVPFFDIRTSKIAPRFVVFCTFLNGKCASPPQPRAIFEQNWSAIVVFCTFWLENVLRATAACNFCGSKLSKSVPSWGVLYILTWKCASRHSGVPFFIYLRNSYLRTRRFSEATFRTSGTTNHWENIATSLTFGACGSFFLVTLLACWSSFCWLDCSTLLFNSAYCRKLDF